jgi:hypothetical protein
MVTRALLWRAPRCALPAHTVCTLLRPVALPPLALYGAAGAAAAVLLLLLLLSGGPVATAAAAASRRRNSAIGQSAGCAGLSLAQTERWSNQSRNSRPPRASQVFIILGVV